MDKSLEALHKELQSIRTGRATPALIDRLQVDEGWGEIGRAHV